MTEWDRASSDPGNQAVTLKELKRSKAKPVDFSTFSAMANIAQPLASAKSPFAISEAGAKRLGVQYQSAEERLKASAHYVQPFDPLWNRDNERRRQGQAIPQAQQRSFRNEQRNIGRDISATQREIAKLPDGSPERGYLENRLRSLSMLRELMRQYQDTPEGKVYNSRSTRMEAYEEYLMNFKGAGNLKRQREHVQNLRVDEGPDTFMARLQAKVGVNLDDVELGFPMMEDLYRDYVMALRQYDSPRAAAILRKMQNVSADRLYRDGRMTTQTAGLR